MDCPVLLVPFGPTTATNCPRCGYALGENGPINLPRDTGRSWRSLRTATFAILFALILLGAYAYFTR